MAFEPFNSVGGYTVGIPPTPVINENGIATLAGLQVYGISNLGLIDNIIIDGGEDGYVLQTDGLGRLSWTAQTGGGGGNGSPGGSNSEVQFNNAGSFGGDPGFTYNSITNQLGVSGNIVATNFTGTGNLNIANIIATGNISANYFLGNGSLLTGIANANYAPVANFANYAGNVTVSNQPNITTVGTLTSLSVSGNAKVGNLSANFIVGNLIPTPNVTYSLGNNTNRWKDLYLAGNSIYLGNVILSDSANSVSVNGGTGNIVAYNISNVPGSNIIGQVANALVSSTVYSNAQPNITTVGTLLNLNVTGNVRATANIVGSNIVANQYFTTLNATVTDYANLNGRVTIGSTGSLYSYGNVDFYEAANITFGELGNLHIAGGIPGYFLRTDGEGNLSWAPGGGGGNGSPGGNTTSVQFNDNGLFNGSANFTYNQFSYTLSVNNIHTKNISIDNNLTVNALTSLSRLAVTDQSNFYGNINTVAAPNISLGDVANIHIQGGTNGQVLQTDGDGNLSWTTGGGGGGGNPGGTNTQVQFNNAGAFGGSTNFTFNNTSKTLTVGGDLVANSITVGSGIYKFSRTSVYFATSVTTLETLLMEFPTANTAGLDFTIISTDPLAGNRQICKLEAVYYANTVHYSEYNTIQVNGPVGNFAVTYDAGDVSNPPRASLYVYPTTSNMTTYKIQVTAYQE